VDALRAAGMQAAIVGVVEHGEAAIQLGVE
jgi:hypothetical protein